MPCLESNTSALLIADGFASNNGILRRQQRLLRPSWNTPKAVSFNLYSGTEVPFDQFPDMAIDTYTALGSHPGWIYMTWTASTSRAGSLAIPLPWAAAT